MPKDFTFEEATEPKEFSFEDAAPEPEPTYPPTYSPRELGPESPTGREESLSPLTFAEWWKATPVRREMEQKFGAGGVPTPKELVDTAFKFASVPPQVAEPYRKITDAYYSALPPAIGGTAAGLRDVALEFPIAAGAVGMGKTIGRLVMGLFTGEYAIAIPEMWQAFKTAKEQGRTREAYQIATKAIAGGLLLGAGGAMEVAGMRGGKVPPVIAKPEAPKPPTIPIPEVPPETAALLPKAAAEVAKPEQPAAPAAQPETPDASGIQETTEVHGDVRPLAKPASTLPVKEGGEGVQPQASGGLPKPEEAARPAQGAVLLTPAVQASGQTFTGTSHAEAIIAAARKGVDATQAEHVFLDAQGNVLNRLDAAKVWEAATGRKVMKPELGLQSEDLMAAPALSLKPFEVDDQLVMRSPHTGEDTVVSYRGKPSTGQAVVWTGKSQIQVPESWLRRQGEQYEPRTEVPKPTTTNVPTVENKTGAVVSKSHGEAGGGKTSTYHGYTIESTPKAVQVGYSTATKLFGKGRQVGGFIVTDAEGYGRHFDTLKEAKSWIDTQGEPTPPPAGPGEGVPSKTATASAALPVTSESGGVAAPPEAARQPPASTVSVKGQEETGAKAVQAQVTKAPPSPVQQTKPPSEMSGLAQKKFLVSEVDKAIKTAPDTVTYNPHPKRLQASSDRAALQQLLDTMPTEKTMFPKETEYAYHSTQEWNAVREAQAKWWQDNESQLKPFLDKWGIERKTSPGYATLDPEQPSGPVDLGIESAVKRLTETLDSAIKGIPDTVTIDIPGDGTFEVHNSKAALEDFKKRAKKFPTKASVTRQPYQVRTEPTAPPTVVAARTAESDLKAIADFRSSEPSRVVLGYAFSDGSHIVTTDGRRMIIVDRSGMGGTPKKPVALDENGKVVKGKDLNIPNWNQVIPNPKELKPMFTQLDTARTFNLLKQAIGVLPEGETGLNYSVTLWRDSEGRLGLTSHNANFGDYATGITKTSEPVMSLNGRYLLEALSAARRLGSEKVDLLYKDELSPLVIQGKGWKHVLMPLRMEGTIAAEAHPEYVPPTPPAPGPGMGEGPGALTAGTPPTGKAQIEQLADAFKNKAPAGQRVAQLMRGSFDYGTRIAQAKDAVSRAISGLKSSGDALWTSLTKFEKPDELLQAKGQLSAELETRGWRVRQFANDVKRAIPDVRRRAAISKWIDSGGDQATLQAGMSATKPEYRQAYADAMNLRGDDLIAAQNISNYFEARLQEAIDAGVLEHGLDDYIHRIYEKDPGLVQRASAYVQSGILSKNPSLAKKRLFQFDWEAEAAGKRPVQDFLPRVTDYETSLSRAIAAREFIAKLSTMTASDGRPIIGIKGVGIPVEDPAGVRTGTLIQPKGDFKKAQDPTDLANYREDYEDRTYPSLKKWKWVGKDAADQDIFLQGDVAIHKDYAKRIDRLLAPSAVRKSPVGSMALGLGSTVKQTMLDFSLFHHVQIGVHAMEHRVMPWSIIKDIDFENPKVEGLLKGGVTLGGEYRGANLGEGLVGRSISRHIPGLGPVMESYHEWLFQSFIPRVKMTMALHALERNRARYAKDLASGRMTETDLNFLTAKQANAAFGELNYITMERSKTFQDMARLVLLAPDFLEARAKFAAQAFTKYGREQRVALFLGAAALYTAARVFNKLLDDQYHFEPENLFNVVYKNNAYSLRTVQGDLLHLYDKPMQFWLSRLNPVYGRTILEAASQRDYYGRKRTPLQIAGDAVSTVVPISMRSSRERHLWESFLNGVGITARRWNDVQTAYKLASEWKTKNHIREAPGEFVYDADKDPLRPLKIALSEGDEPGSVKEIGRVLASKALTLQQMNQYFQRYSRAPFTGSMGNDRKWYASLSKDHQQTVDAARQHRQAMWTLYSRARGQYFQSLTPLRPADLPK